MDDLKENIFSQIHQSSPELELWWDSPPTRFNEWRESFLLKIQKEKYHEDVSNWLSNFFDPKKPKKTVIGGCTTNPRLVFETISENPDYWREIIKSTNTKHFPSDERYWNIYKKIFEVNAKLIKPIWDCSNGKYGWVCAQIPPNLSFYDEEIIKCGIELHDISPNVMVKVVGSEQGYRAIKELVSRGIPINNTLSFSVPQHLSCIDAIREGYSAAIRNNVDLSRWRAVITLMIGRFGASEEFIWQAENRNISLDTYKLRQAELAIFYKVYSLIKATHLPIKILVCSLKIDRVLGENRCIHLEGIAGTNSIVTLPPAFVESVLTSDFAYKKLRGNNRLKKDISNTIPKLLAVPYFSQGYNNDGISDREYFYHPVFLKGLVEVNSAYRKTIELIEHC